MRLARGDEETNGKSDSLGIEERHCRNFAPVVRLRKGAAWLHCLGCRVKSVAVVSADLTAMEAYSWLSQAPVLRCGPLGA